jgi:hypothetical protein
VAEAGRGRWTDERIDDVAVALRNEVRELRSEMREGFRDLRAEMADGLRDLRAEMNAGFREVRGEASLNRRLLMNLWVTTLLGLVGLLVETSLR